MSHPKFSDEETLDFDLGIDQFIEKYIAKDGSPSSLHYPVWDLLDRGGKRFRPLLANLCCKVVGGNSQRITPLAAAVELLHNMTLMHDDIEDASDVRRGKPCLHHLYGLPIAINTGDFMAVKVFEIILSQRLPEELKMRIMEKVVERVTQMLHGQAIEIESRELPLFDMELAIDIMKYKTAALVILASEIGVLMGGGTEVQLKIVQRYAGYVGLAFQITDDVLNLIATRKYGKEIGGDLREGKRTVIVSHFMLAASEEDKSSFLRLFGKKEASVQEIEIMISLLKKYGSIEHAQKLADYYLKCGLNYLPYLPESDARSSLVKLSRFLTRRNW